ncbi:LysR family transcriptional regulator [Paraburkholderia pallida]|uniref:LysR family transcriptional regulator n=1 Tax=Paraburkholderia pallida TaxID=2547399 RepID=A0A4P7D4Y5_9BURK|nr:LysR family transcriptional regulator [Paraburkholderia pallida]QBR03759.1 LysR family transcriptional regulator [Paraburkholderia pallida]
MKLRELDLNLLLVLHELLAQGSASKAAESLGMSQPAVSNSLNRLRKMLGDDLFLRTSKGLTPTRFAEHLNEPIAHALRVILDSVNAVSIFDPATSNRNFNVALTDVGEIYFLPALMQLLSKAGAGITINSVRNTAVNLRDEMESGRIDLAIGLLPDLDFGFFQRKLFSQQYVCLFRRGHPFETLGCTREGFEAAEHVSVLAEGTGYSAIEAMLDRARVKRNVKLHVPNFVAVGYILQSTDMVAIVPAAYARRAFGTETLATAPCPIDIPEISINVLWHAQNHRDAGNQWLRQLIYEHFAAQEQ